MKSWYARNIAPILISGCDGKTHPARFVYSQQNAEDGGYFLLEQPETEREEDMLASEQASNTIYCLETGLLFFQRVVDMWVGLRQAVRKLRIPEMFPFYAGSEGLFGGFLRKRLAVRGESTEKIG